MFLNEKDIVFSKVEDFYDWIICVYSGDENKYITFSFNREVLVLDNIKVNETIDLINIFIGILLLHMDQMKDNLYNLDVDMEMTDDMLIYNPDENYEFDSLKFNVYFSFAFDYVIPPNPKIAKFLGKDINWN